MKMIDLANADVTIAHILSLAEQESVLIRTASGKAFVVAEVPAHDASEDDFAHEVPLTRVSPPLRELLCARSNEPAAYTLTEVRQKLGLSQP